MLIARHPVFVEILGERKRSLPCMQRERREELTHSLASTLKKPAR